MGRETAIAWCDHTFNAWWGCQKVSPACDHCYAETWAKRTGHAVWGPRSPRRFFGENHWREPLQWAADAARDGVRRRVFCSSMADVCEDRRDLDGEREKLWALIRRTAGSLDWLLLTKRADAIGRLIPADVLALVWMGCTAENQKCADDRWKHLSQIDASVRFLSVEPMIEPITLRHWATLPDWVICGGESGAKDKARDFHASWARALRNECRELGISFYMKQMGRNPVVTEACEDCAPCLQGAPEQCHAAFEVHAEYKHKAGADPDEWDADLRVRAFPR